MNYKELLFNKDKVLTFCPELSVILNEYDKYLVKIGYEANGKKWKSKQCGLNAAIVLNQINYWNELNEKLGSKKHFKDGYYWTFHAYDKWAKEDFPFWSGDTVRRAVKFLEDMGLVISTDKYNLWKVDNTKWYRIDFEKLQEIINIVEKLRKENDMKKQVADTVNADCDSVMASCIDGLGNTHKAIPENTNIDYINRDYSTENTDKYAFPDKSEKVDVNIYASFPEEKEVEMKKPSRYIPEDYTEEQLVEHIKPVIKKSIDFICDGQENKEELSSTLIEVVRIFYRKYYLAFGKRHRILSDMAYENIAERFMFPPDIMCDEDTQYDIKSYADMMDVYFTTEYNKQKKYSKEIELSISHFMSDEIRSNLFYRACYYER